jgi:rod shape-determining protein MreC
MQQILNFLIRNRNFILFLVLFSVAVSFTIQSHSYHKSKFIKSTNWITGGVYNTFSNIGEYFSLKQKNIQLAEENKQLRSLLYNIKDSTQITPFIDRDSTNTSTYIITTGKVIRNSFTKANNHLLINVGKKKGITQDMGVVSSRGIVGIVESSSKNFSVVQSILNTSSQINAKLKKTSHFGTLSWDTQNAQTAQLSDIPRLVELHIGDTVVTGGMSSIFPEGIPIGTIKDFNLNEAKNYYNINIALFNDMTNLRHIYIVKNKLKKEADSLLNTVPNE